MPRAYIRPAKTSSARTPHERPLWTAILGLLEQRVSHGYELVTRLNELPSGSQPAPVDAVSVYRALRAMEAEGMVSSTWDVSRRGPARRVYVPTPTGQAVGN